MMSLLAWISNHRCLSFDMPIPFFLLEKLHHMIQSVTTLCILFGNMTKLADFIYYKQKTKSMSRFLIFFFWIMSISSFYCINPKRKNYLMFYVFWNVAEFDAHPWERHCFE
jgi:hypothetical protein